jgi:hypothetical protein
MVEVLGGFDSYKFDYSTVEWTPPLRQIAVARFAAIFDVTRSGAALQF